ncbi:MAG: glycosyl transferase, partial [Cyclobacteriaceae bacterium]|nr:glycosyl transferase [Cyclobacteriaceae bacterium]
MNIAFTVVSRNYLPAARSLAQSFLQHNPGWQFSIGLLERKSVTVEALPGEELLYVEDLAIPEFEAMNRQYSIFELSCALKPFYAHYFFNARGADRVIYLDSDILVFSAFRLYEQHPETEIFITPHLLASDGRVEQYELFMLQGGIYNGGFVGLRRGPQALDFLGWWKDRMTKYSFQGKPGLFVDQVWLNHAPAYFDRTCIVQDPGCNVAYWNLTGRKISGNYRVNEASDLIFFHYSGYKLGEPDRMSVYQDLLSFSSRPDVKPLFDTYAVMLRELGHDEYSRFKCTLG